MCECKVDDNRFYCVDESVYNFIECNKFQYLVNIFPELEILKLSKEDKGEVSTKKFHLQFNPDEYQIPVTDNIANYLRIIKYLIRNNITNSIFDMYADYSDILVIYIAFYNYIIKVKSYDADIDNHDYHALIMKLKSYYETTNNNSFIKNIMSYETYSKISKYFDCEYAENPLAIWYRSFSD